MKRVWALVAVLFLCDLAMPLSPGAFRFELSQSLEIVQRASTQVAAAGHLPQLQHPSKSAMRIAGVPEASRLSMTDHGPARLPRSIPLRSPQDESEALAASEDD